jgi:hypothetical protein
MRKMQYFNENMLGKFVGFGHMHKNKIFFFVFFKGKFNLNFFEIFFKMF